MKKVRYEIHYCKNKTHFIEHYPKKKNKDKALIEYFSQGIGFAYAREKHFEFVQNCAIINKKPLSLKKYIIKLAKTFHYGKVKDTYIYVFEREIN